MSLDESAAGNLSGHRRILGACWLVYGILRFILGFVSFCLAEQPRSCLVRSSVAYLIRLR